MTVIAALRAAAPRHHDAASLRVAGVVLAALVALGATAPAAAAATSANSLVAAWRTAYSVSSTQESGTRLAWTGTWRRQTDARFLAGAQRVSRAYGASVTLRFTGTGIAWAAARGTGYGKARVSVDGVAVATVDSYLSTFGPARVMYSRTWAASGTHRITIRNLGTSGHPAVSLDAFLVRGARLPVVSGTGAPATDLPGWKLQFADGFDAALGSGQFPSAVSSRWWAYGPGWKDTSGRGTYSTDNITQHDGMLDMWLHTVNGVRKVAAVVPRLPGGASDQTYGRYAVRFRADAVAGYKAAWMLWPKSDIWPGEGEIDFPEGDLDDTMSAFMHYTGATRGSDQWANTTTTGYTSWHTAVIEWSPAAVRFILDDRVLGSATTRLPKTPFHWVLQNETSLSVAPSDAAQGHVFIDWIAIWSYNP